MLLRKWKKVLRFVTRVITRNEITTGNPTFLTSEAEFKDFRHPLRYGWFHLKLYSMFQDLSRSLIETGFRRIEDATQIP